MKVEIEVTEIVILYGFGPDMVTLKTTMPTTFPPEVSSDPLWLDFKVAAGDGREYVAKNFPGIPVREINRVGR